MKTNQARPGDRERALADAVRIYAALKNQYKLEALALSPRAVAKEQGALAGCLDRLEAERALADAVRIYAALKNRYESTGARGPPRPAASGKEGTDVRVLRWEAARSG